MKQESQSTAYESPKKKATSQKKLTFKEPCRSEPRGEVRRGVRALKSSLKETVAQMRPAGVPSCKNRWDQDWMKLTRNDRPNSVPSRISRFTQKASHQWRMGDTSAFEYDRPRIKRSGSRKSAQSGNLNIYPDWWGDGSVYDSKSSRKSRSRSRSKFDDEDVDDFDRKVTFKPDRKRILKKLPNNFRQHNYAGHPSDETSPVGASITEEYQTEECQTEEVTEDEAKEKNRDIGYNKAQRKSKKNQPIVSNRQSKGTIYSKLKEREPEIDRNEAPIKTKHAKQGYAMTFSPNLKKKGKKNAKENRDVNVTNYHHREEVSSDDGYDHRHRHYQDSGDRHQKTYVRQSEQYQARPKKQHKQKSMKEIRDQDRQRAIEHRNAVNHVRTAHDQSYHELPRRKIPKNLQNVESVIKKRVQIDKEINRKRRQENLNEEREAIIYAPPRKEHVFYEQQPENNQEEDEKYQEMTQTESMADQSRRSGSRSHSKSRSNSYTRQRRQQDSESQAQSNQLGVQSNRERQYSHSAQNDQNTQNQKSSTEGSGYPSVTQATAPHQDYYDRNQGMPHQRQVYEEKKSDQQRPPQNYRPSSISQGPDRENNVVDITEGFLNSPMMTQFSDTSEVQRRQFAHMQSREEESRKYDNRDYSGYTDSKNYGPYQNRSDESIYGHQNPYENHQAYQHSSNKNPMSNPVSNSNTNYSRFGEDQVLFKSNGFEGNGTSSGKANDSAMLQSPNVQNRGRNEGVSDSKLTATANFERPRDYDVKYSDYRRGGSRDRSYGERPQYYQNRQPAAESHINPFKARDAFHHTRPEMMSSGHQSFNYNPAAEFQNRGYNYQAPGSYKYSKNNNETKLGVYYEGNDQSIASPPMSMDTSMKHAPPKYLQPQDASNDNSQYLDEEGFESESEGEESESDYDDTELSRSDDYASSSLSNYKIQDEDPSRGAYRGHPGMMSHPSEYYGGETHNYYQPSPNYQNMPHSNLDQSEMNPQLMSSIGSDAVNMHHFHPQMNRDMPPGKYGGY